LPLRPCLEPGCHELVRSGRCPAHQRNRDARKNAQSHRWVYRDPRWLRTRRVAIARAGGRCEIVENGHRCPETSGLHGHHNYPGGVRQMLIDSVSPFDDRRVRAVCETHHARLEAELRARRRQAKGR
jgi:hypothetical protein